jgi:ABC-type Zn2+ transport system substrate-binding protein/surface adhesin
MQDTKNGQAHSHTHTHTHDHPHNHPHDHSHEDGGHDHHDSHDHDHAHETPGQSGGRQRLILGYMLDHNKQHMDELAKIGEKLDAAGQSESAALIATAVARYEEGNTLLAQSLAAMEGE